MRAVRYALVLMLAAMTAPLCAQTYPSKPVRIVVPFPPAGAVDIVGRVLGEKLAQSMGQPFVVENRAGAGGIVGSEVVARATADGYTLLAVSSAHATNPTLFPKIPYNTERDFAPVSLVAGSSYMLVTHPSMPVKSVRELIAFAKARPGTINFASGGPASLPHLSGELFNLMAGVALVHVPYKGSAPAATAALGGEVPLLFSNMLGIMPFVQAGRFRALGVTGTKRVTSAPEVPTIAEAGVPGYEVTGWYGLVAPAGTPKDIVARLSAQTAAAMRAPEVVKRFSSEGAEPAGSTPEAFAEVIARDTAKWAKVIRASGAKVD
ncbi:MAG: tripartite tricarboxylate transporter substrate binding protein [Betaproteobacteria bacterium]|nr:tripartite tricarboxylate transporter substrate binding protein [Betaproteobacteria bacterium]